MNRAAGQPEQEEAVDRAEAKLAAFGAFPRARHVVQ